jgi:hypothetical protein
MPSVPRVADITGRKPADQVRLEREAARIRSTLQSRNRPVGEKMSGKLKRYFKQMRKEQWRRDVGQTRSF